MSDTTFISPQERYVDLFEMQQMHLDSRQVQIHTAMPAQIVGYNAAKMTVTVQPAIQMVRFMPDGTKKPVTMAVIQDVPVFFPSGGGHILTFPIAAGDECLLVFGERSIDNWFQHGGVQLPSDHRLHDINDAFVLVGVRPQPKVLGAKSGGSLERASAPAASSGTAQLRSDDGKTVIDVNGSASVITVTAEHDITLSNGDGSSTVNVLGNTGEISIKCQHQITLDCPRVVVTGQINCYSEVIAQANTLGYVTLSGHWKHSGTPSGPTPGT